MHLRGYVRRITVCALAAVLLLALFMLVFPGGGPENSVCGRKLLPAVGARIADAFTVEIPLRERLGLERLGVRVRNAFHAEHPSADNDTITEESIP